MNLNAIAIPKRPRARDDRINESVIDRESREFAQRFDHDRVFLAKLLGIGDLLPAATSADAGDRTQWRYARRRGFDKPDNTGFGEILFDKCDFGFKMVAGGREWNEDDETTAARDTSSADREAFDF